MTEDKGKSVGVIDQSGIVMPKMVDNSSFTFVDYSTESVENMKNRLDELGLDALVAVSELDTQARTVYVTSYSNKPLSMDLKEAIQSRVDNAVEDYRLSLYDISDLKQIMKDVKSNVVITSYTMDDSTGEEKISSSEVYMIISLILSMIIYMFIAMFSGMVMQSVIEEKSSRVVEVLVSSVKATELMFGKIIGVACVALTQFLLWILLTDVLVSVGMGFIAPKLIGDADPAALVEQMSGGMQEMEGMQAMEGMNASSDMMAALSQNSELGSVIATIQGINIGAIALYFIVFFILGYLLYASLFAAIGSAVENEGDSQQLQMPVTIPLMIGYFIALYAFNAPDSSLAVWGSLIPFTSPIVMLARIPFGVPLWQIALSIVLLLATTVAMAWLSAKIYKVGILMFGKKTTFKDLWKWLKMK